MTINDKPVRRKVLSFYRVWNKQQKRVETRWRLRATNGSLIDSSNEGFVRPSAAENNAALALTNGGKVIRTPDTDAGLLDGRDDVRVEWVPKDAPVEGMPRARTTATKAPAKRTAKRG